jgi:hypothetical protein
VKRITFMDLRLGQYRVTGWREPISMSGLGKAAGVILRQAVLFFRSEARLFLPDWTAASSFKSWPLFWPLLVANSQGFGRIARSARLPASGIQRRLVAA